MTVRISCRAVKLDIVGNIVSGLDGHAFTRLFRLPQHIVDFGASAGIRRAAISMIGMKEITANVNKATLPQFGSPIQINALLETIFSRRDARDRLGMKTMILLFQDDVHHASHGI